MRYILHICSVLVLVTIIRGSFLFDDPGDALFLTQYIERGDIETARNLALVPHTDIPIENYAGYLTVNKVYNSNLFFWFFPAAINPDDSPLLLWLQGPGSSSLIGLFLENGPYSITANGQLIPKAYSWCTNHNVVYIDSPVGTGFSFTHSPNGYAKNMTDVSRELMNALHQFLLLFPNLQQNEFFICGESYAGKFATALGYAIHQYNKHPTADCNGFALPKINLQGLTIGNGYIDPLHQFVYSDYLYELGLIDSYARQIFAKQEKQQVDCILKRDYECAYEIFQNLIHLMPGSLFNNLTGYNGYFNYLSTAASNYTLLNAFAQNPETRRAIHVGNHAFSNSDIVNVAKLNLIPDVMISVADWFAELLSHYPILIYNGQLDIISAYPMTETFLNQLDFVGADQFRKSPRYIFRVANDIAGYMKIGGNLISVMVRDAGHMTAMDQPNWMLNLILKFTYHKGLP